MLCTLNLPHSLKVEATQNVSSLQKLLVGLLTFLMHHYCTSLALYCIVPGKCPPPNLTVLCLRVTIYLWNGIGNIEIVMHIRVSHVNV